MSFSSDSGAQSIAETLIRDAVAQNVGVDLQPRRLTLDGGAVVDVDGVAEDDSILVEIFAHQGQLKGGQRHKIAGDALKLITIARERTPPPKLILAFGDPEVLKFFDGKSRLAAAVKSWSIDVFVAELSTEARDHIRVAQARQIMVNPPD